MKPSNQPGKALLDADQVPVLDRLYVELSSISDARTARELTVADALYRAAALLIEYQPLIAAHCDVATYELMGEALHDAQAALAMIGLDNLSAWRNAPVEPLDVPEH